MSDVKLLGARQRSEVQRWCDTVDRTPSQRRDPLEPVHVNFYRSYEATVQHLEQQLAEAREEIERLRGITDPRRIACALQGYEMDEPHSDEEADPVYPDILWSTIEGWLAAEHHGDCTNVAMACSRCVAEDVWHKARWLSERLRGGEGE